MKHGALLMDSFQRNDRVPVLDGLRGIAIILVLLSHTSNAGMHLIPGLNMAGSGKFGVWLFFVLSAFLLTSQLLVKDQNRKLNLGAWLNYAMRRVFRIYPMYLVFLLVAWSFPKMGLPRELEGPDVLRHLSLHDGAGHLWSIPVEFKYYLALPFVFAFYVWVCRRSFAFSTIITFVLISLHWAYGPTDDPIALLTYIPIFLLGSWSALLSRKLKSNASGKSVTHLRKLALTTLLLLLFLLAFVMTPSIWSVVIAPISPTHWRDSYTLFGIIWSAIVVICMLGHDDRVEGVLASKPLRFFGIVSFSAYLWHPALITLAAGWAGLAGTGQALFVLVATSVLASVSYLLIERPSMHFAKIIAKGWPDKIRSTFA